MRRNISSIWWLAAVLLLALSLVACERPLQEEESLETLTPDPNAQPVIPPAGGTPGLLLPTPTAPGVDAYPAPGEVETPAAEGPMPAPTEAPTAESVETPAEDVIYIVTAGDTLVTIAQQYGVTVEAIAAANNLANVNALEVGQELLIPLSGEVDEAPPAGDETVDEGAPPAEEQVHIVQPGDNLYRIGLQYGWTIEALVAYNNLTNPNRLEVGQEIRIPPEGYTP